MYDSVLGWMDFRQCGRDTFNYVNAALMPKYLLSSGSMSERSLIRVTGEYFTMVSIVSQHCVTFYSYHSPDTLGITRDSVLPFTRNPARLNIYQHVVTVPEIHPRYFRSLPMTVKIYPDIP